MMKKRVPARDNLPETFGRIPVRELFLRVPSARSSIFAFLWQ